MSFPIHTQGLDAHGVLLIPPTAADFDARVHQMFPKQAGLALELKPYLVIVLNNSPQTIGAYDVHFTFKNRGGEMMNSLAQFKYPDAVAGSAGDPAFPRGQEVYPGEQRLIGINFEVSSEKYVKAYRDWGVQENAAHRDTTELRVELDAVIFDDGSLLGADSEVLNVRFSDHFAEYVKANQSLYSSIVQNVESGKSLDEAFPPFEGPLSAPPIPTYLDLYRHLAKQEVRSWRKKLGDQAIYETLKKAIRKQPFAIHR